MVLKRQLSKCSKPGDSRSWQSTNISTQTLYTKLPISHRQHYCIISCYLQSLPGHRPLTHRWVFDGLFLLFHWKIYQCCEMPVTWALPQICAPPMPVQSCCIQRNPGQQWAKPRARCPWAHRWQVVVWDLAPACLQLIVLYLAQQDQVPLLLLTQCP